jgi:peptidoglycan/LPS O-acetylase OafA/YrhL
MVPSPGSNSTGLAPAVEHRPAARRAVIERPAAPLNALTSLRFFAAAMIVIAHGSGEFGFPLGADALFALNTGVSFFFVLSGFILYYNYPFLPDRTAVGRFYLARFARIWPLHVFAFIVVLITYPSAAWVQPGIARWLAGLLSISLLQAWFPLIDGYTGAFNAPAWTLSVEVFFYLLFPWLLPRVRDAATRTLLGGLLLSLACSVVANAMGGPRSDLPLDQWNWYLLDHSFPLSRLAEFVLGMATAHWWTRYRQRGMGNIAAGTLLELGAIALLAAAMAYVHRVPELANWLGSGTGDWLAQVALAPAYALLIVAAASGRGSISSWLGQPLLVRLGELSYAVYLLHIAVLASIPWPRLTASLGAQSAMLGFVLVLLGVAYVAWRCVESRARAFILRRGRDRSGRERRAPAPSQSAG